MRPYLIHKLEVCKRHERRNLNGMHKPIACRCIHYNVQDYKEEREEYVTYIVRIMKPEKRILIMRYVMLLHSKNLRITAIAKILPTRTLWM